MVEEGRQRMPREQRTYEQETLSAVLAELATGERPYALSRKYGIPRKTIEGWRDRAGLATVGLEKRKTLEQRGLQLLHESLDTVEAILRESRKPEWIQRQEANGLYLFLGTLMDKVITLYAAAERADRIRLESGRTEEFPSLVESSAVRSVDQSEIPTS